MRTIFATQIPSHSVLKQFSGGMASLMHHLQRVGELSCLGYILWNQNAWVQILLCYSFIVGLRASYFTSQPQFPHL